MPGTGVRGATLFTRRCPTQFRRRCSLRQLASSAAQQQQQAAVVAVDNPYSGETYARTPELDATELLARARSAAEAQKVWGRTPLSQRVDICSGAIEWFQANADAIAADISGMMGKPRHHARGEIGGLEERARHMMALAPAALADEELPDTPGATRWISKEPVGTVFVMAPWNYPLLTACNAVFPAVLAGNAVMIKHSPRTPLCADHFAEAFAAAGAPPGLVQSANCGHGPCAQLLTSKAPAAAVQHVVFTGSVRGGQAIYRTTASASFADVTLELGGKDAAYVAEDADLESAVACVVDGAIFNNGQSCCAMERAYVHHTHYEAFLQRAQALMAEEVLGDPADPTTTMGPLAMEESSARLQAQVADAVSKGARLLAGGEACQDAAGRGRFFAPTLLADCTHEMEVMQQETFGPILPVAAVDSDDVAVERINDSDYGLTAAIFSPSAERVRSVGERLEVGTVFANRCDYLDPALPWGGRKDTGKGVSLSSFGFNSYFKLKGYNLKGIYTHT